MPIASHIWWEKWSTDIWHVTSIVLLYVLHVVPFSEHANNFIIFYYDYNVSGKNWQEIVDDIIQFLKPVIETHYEISVHSCWVPHCRHGHQLLHHIDRHASRHNISQVYDHVLAFYFRRHHQFLLDKLQSERHQIQKLHLRVLVDKWQ